MNWLKIYIIPIFQKSIFQLTTFNIASSPPPCWKTALTAHILKSLKPPQHPSSYRPFFLLYSLCKLTEAFIDLQLDTHSQKSNIMSPKYFNSVRLSLLHTRCTGSSSTLLQANLLRTLLLTFSLKLKKRSTMFEFLA